MPVRKVDSKSLIVNRLKTSIHYSLFTIHLKRGFTQHHFGMFFVYLLKSKLFNQIYIGSTNNLKRRLKEHNDGKYLSTKRYKPWNLLYLEGYVQENLARVREKRLKYHGNALRELKKRIGLIKSGAGFTLVEILLSIFLILAIVSILFATSGTFVSSRKSNLQSIATKIASREIETLRNTAFASLPACPGPAGCNINAAEEPDLSKLPSGSATKTLDDYEGSNKIKQTTIKINWIENGANQNIKLETLISENGL